jgi:hypothetical protein
MKLMNYLLFTLICLLLSQHAHGSELATQDDIVKVKTGICWNKVAGKDTIDELCITLKDSITKINFAFKGTHSLPYGSTRPGTLMNSAVRATQYSSDTGKPEIAPPNILAKTAITLERDQEKLLYIGNQLSMSYPNRLSANMYTLQKNEIMPVLDIIKGQLPAKSADVEDVSKSGRVVTDEDYERLKNNINGNKS